MRPILITPVLSLVLLIPIAGQDQGVPAPAVQRRELTTAQQEAIEELNEAVRSYREGDFPEAELHAEKALALDPLNKTAPLFIARTIHAQYKPGDQTEANIVIARLAVGAYKRILEQNSHNEEAYRAIAYLYNAVKDEGAFRQWVFQRALDPTFSDEQRAEAYVVLASNDWDCSFKITTLPANQVTLLNGRSMEVHFIKPKDLAEFEKAQRCSVDGLAMIDAAITLDPDSEVAWAYKANLLLELARLAEMDGEPQLKAEYTNQSKAAQKTTAEIRNRQSTLPLTKP